MPNKIDLNHLNRREHFLHSRALQADDLKVLYPGVPPRKMPPWELTIFQRQMDVSARRAGTRLEFYPDVKLGMYRVFGVNWHGFRYHFADFKAFSSADVRATAAIFAKIGKMSKDFQERTKKKDEDDLKTDENTQDEATYRLMTDNRMFQRAKRVMYGGGKTNLPVGIGVDFIEKEESKDANVYSPYPY